jgi:UDP-2,4-diacetamido-2,4,6-trideoxy-beta-L-altropyranose hydrolase
MKVIFRADASVNIGLGHLKRCLSLASALRTAGAQVFFVAPASAKLVADLVDASGFIFVSFAEPQASQALSDDRPGEVQHWQVSQSADAAETSAAIAPLCPDWVIVDHYGLGSSWHDFVHKQTGACIAAIDDLADRKLNVDVMINQNLTPDNASVYAALLPEHTRLLTGLRFAILDPCYAKATRHQPKEAVHSIGIFMGGTDTDNFSLLALDACRRLAGFEGEIEIATTTANPNLAALVRTCATDSRTTLLVDSPNLAAFFSRHDLQVGAGGSATWERFCIGVPTVTLLLAANQRAVVAALQNVGARYLEFEADRLLLSKQLANEVRALLADTKYRHDQSEKIGQLVDGLGATRIAAAMLRERLTVRLATVEDAPLMHQWRNHPSVRETSTNANPIDYQSHVTWVTQSLRHPGRCLLLGHLGALPVGVIRFDVPDNTLSDKPQTVEVSLYLAPALLSLGLGPYLLQAGERFVVAHWATITTITATVLASNIRSRTLFLDAGYHWSAEKFVKIFG